MRPALAEKTGLNMLLEEEQKKLMGLMATKEEFMKQRAVAMDRCWERDCDEIVKAFKSSTTNKDVLVKILSNRTKWQVEAIAAIYQKKTGKTLLASVLNDSSMQSALGSRHLSQRSSLSLPRYLSYLLFRLIFLLKLKFALQYSRQWIPTPFFMEIQSLIQSKALHIHFLIENSHKI
jgi:hypothetical protein